MKARPAAWILATAALGLLQPAAVEAVDPSARAVYADGRVVELAPGSPPFAAGEFLEYELQYSLLTVGNASLELSDVEGRQALRIISRARSASWVDAIYPVRDTIVSVLDLACMCSLRFEKHLREGKYRRDMVATYDHERGVAVYADAEVAMQPGSQDILSALYFVRTLKLEVGMVLDLTAHDDRKTYALEARVLRREKVTTPLGGFDCLVVQPELKSGGIFKSEGRLLVWISDDERKLPVMMKARAPVGAFASVLTKYRPGGAGEE